MTATDTPFQDLRKDPRKKIQSYNLENEFEEKTPLPEKIVFGAIALPLLAYDTCKKILSAPKKCLTNLVNNGAQALGFKDSKDI